MDSNVKSEDNSNVSDDFFDSNNTNASKASKIRIKLSGFYPSIKNDIRKLYYSISEFKVKGLCDCNGYSSECDIDASPNYKCNCLNDTFTEGFMVNAHFISFSAIFSLNIFNDDFW